MTSTPPDKRYETSPTLLQRAQANQAGAWERLVELYGPLVYHWCGRSQLAPEDTADVFQDVFTRAFMRLDTLRDASALRPWIAQLTRRRCLDAVSSGGREQQVSDDDLVEEGNEDMLEIEEAFMVREAVAGLSDACQDIIDRFFAQDQSYRTISEELDIPAGTIASRIARCLGKLRNELEARD